MVPFRRLTGPVALVLALAACQPVGSPGGGSAAPSLGASSAAPSLGASSAAPSASAPSAGVVELTMWNSPVSEPYNQWWSDYIKEFNSTHPNIHVTGEMFESEPYKAKIQSALVSGTAPDVFFMIPGPQAETLFKEGKMTPIGDYIDPTVFVAAARGKCSFDGKLACLPMYLAPSFIFYNKEMFANAGVDTATWADAARPTWEEFQAAADALKAKGITPIALGNGENWPGLFWYWAFQNRYGGTSELNAAIDGSGPFTLPSFIKAGELAQQLKTRGYLTEGFNGISGPQIFSLFTQGKGAMIFQGPWMLATIKDEAPTDFEWGYFHFPTFADGNPDAQTDVMSGVDAQWISATTEHPAEAAEFLKGFTERDRALDFMVKTDNVSSIDGIVAGSAADQPIVALSEASNTAAHAYPWWDWALPQKVTEVMLSMSQGLLDGQMSPKDFAQKMQDSAQ